MSNKTARILSKIGLFLVAIGFFMPFTLKANVFGNLDDLSRMVSWLGIDISSYKFQVYLTFISSVVGVILLVLLLAGKTMRLIFDWSVVIVANGSILILLIRLTNLAKKYVGGHSSGIKDIIGDNLQVGAYCIIIGLISSLVFLLMASFIRDTGRSNNSTKKCPFCANEIKLEAIVCQFCGRDLPPVEQNEKPIKTINPRKPSYYLSIATIVTPIVWLIGSIYFAYFLKNIIFRNVNISDVKGFSWLRYWAMEMIPFVSLSIPPILNILGQNKSNKKMILIAGIINVFAFIYIIYNNRSSLFQFSGIPSLLLYLSFLLIISSTVLYFILFRKTGKQNLISETN